MFDDPVFAEEYNRYKAMVEDYLLSKLNSYANKFVTKGQVKVYEAVRYSVENGGKRIRPVLALATCDLLGGDMESVLPFAAAIELIHTYSLIHDDLPCMDNDDYRRGKPSCHKAYSEAMALLAGDAALNLAFELILEITHDCAIKQCRSSQARKYSKGEYIDYLSAIIQAAGYIANASGMLGMIGGQAIDITGMNTLLSTGDAGFDMDMEAKDSIEAQDTDGTEDADSADGTEDTDGAEDDGTEDIVSAEDTADDMYDEDANVIKELANMHYLKTGRLIVASVISSAIICNRSYPYSDVDYASLERYAENVGVAFQIKDDILDRFGQFDKMGKETGRDEKMGKATFTSVLGRAGAEKYLREVIEDAIESLAEFDSRAWFLEGIARYIAEREK